MSRFGISVTKIAEPVKETLVSLKEAPAKLRLELIRPVSGNSPTETPVVIKSKTIKKTDEVVFFPRLKPLPRAYFVRSIIKRQTQVKKMFGTKTATEYVVRFNSYWSESLQGLTQTIPPFSRELENLLLADDEIQHINGVVDAAKKFLLDSMMLKLMLVVFVLAIPFGLLMDSVLNTVPSQIVIWSP